MVAVAPAAVTLSFDEPVQLVPGTARVVSETGSVADAGTSHSVGPQVLIPLQPDLPRGRYLVSWQVISADGHLVEGSIGFGIGERAAAVVASAPVGRSPLETAYAAAVGATNATVVPLLGLPLAALLLGVAGIVEGRRRLRLIVRAGWCATLLLTLVLLHVDAARTAGDGLLSTAGLDLAATATGSHLGLMHVLRLVAVLVLGVPVWTRRLARLPAAAAWVTGTGLLLLTIGWTGHASVGSLVPLAVASTTLHVTAMVVWLGGLVLLVVRPETVAPRSAEGSIARPARTPSWSGIATTCVVVLVVTGTYQSARQVHPLASLWSTAYGRTLIVKVSILAVCLLVAAGSRAAVHGGGLPPRLPGRLRRLVATELVLATAILAVTGVLVDEAPARETYGPAVTELAPLGPDRLRVQVEATRRGPEQVVVTRVTAEGDEAPLQSLTGRFSSSDAHIAGLDVHFARDADGSWRSLDAVVPLPGRWTLSLAASVTDTTAYATSVGWRVW